MIFLGILTGQENIFCILCPTSGGTLFMKSERLKKLEIELEDLERWLKLGLVPKSDMVKHKEEIEAIKDKLEEEKERLRYMKENGDLEEYVMPKRSQARPAYPEAHTLPDMDMNDQTDIGMEMETEGGTTETSAGEGTETSEVTVIEEEEEDDPFSDKNRWKRGILEDPDDDSW